MKLGDLSTHDVLSVAPSDSIAHAAAMLEQHGIQHLPVVVGRQIVGIVSDRDIMIGCVDLTQANSAQEGSWERSKVEDVMSAPVHTLSPDDVLRAATWLMIHQRLHAIPLVHRDHLVGIVTESDLLRGIAAAPEISPNSLLKQPVAKFMHENLTTVRSSTSLDDVVDLMQRARIRHIPVAFGYELLGIVSDRDVRRALVSSGLRDAQAQEKGEFYLGPTQVHEVMTTDVRTISSSATAEQAIAELLRHEIHCLPVVDARKLLGIITDTDLLRAIGAEEKEVS